MKVAHILPHSMLGKVENTGMHLILPQHLHNPTYLDYYANMPGHRILDNGEAEGITVTAKDLIIAAEKIGAHEIVVPDVMGNCDETLLRARAFATVAKLHPEYTYMGVVQGQNLAELMKCFTGLTALDYIGAVAFPRYISNTVGFDQRYYLIKALGDMGELNGHYVHCLGASTWIREVLLLAELPFIRSIDTSMPANMGLQGVSLKVGPYKPRHPNFFDQELPERDPRLQLAIVNCHTYASWAQAPAR
jgi:hypothetical protein